MRLWKISSKQLACYRGGTCHGFQSTVRTATTEIRTLRELELQMFIVRNFAIHLSDPIRLSDISVNRALTKDVHPSFHETWASPGLFLEFSNSLIKSQQIAKMAKCCCLLIFAVVVVCLSSLVNSTGR